MKKLQRAAALSKSLDADGIKKELGISRRTLNRYVANPKWEEAGGVNPFRRTGQQKNEDNDSLFIRARSLYPSCDYNWAAVARKMNIPVNRLHAVRRNRKELL